MLTGIKYRLLVTIVVDEIIILNMYNLLITLNIKCFNLKKSINKTKIISGFYCLWSAA